jgi:hypothetical protein
MSLPPALCTLYPSFQPKPVPKPQNQPLVPTRHRESNIQTVQYVSNHRDNMEMREMLRDRRGEEFHQKALRYIPRERYLYRTDTYSVGRQVFGKSRLQDLQELQQG